jgi:hypothetical protein
MYLGIALIASGWAVIFVGWYQSGRQDLETGQIPYVISGGFGGFGLLLMGVIAILVDVVRQAESKLRRSAEELHDRMEALAEAFVRNANESRRPSGGSKVAKRRRPRPAEDEEEEG